MNLTKFKPSVWKRLREQEGKDTVWWEIKNIYKEDMEKYERILEREEDNQQKKWDNI